MVLIEISKIMREMEPIKTLQQTTKTATQPIRHSQSLRRLSQWPKATLEASLITIKTAEEENIEGSKLKLLRLNLKQRLTES